MWLSGPFWKAFSLEYSNKIQVERDECERILSIAERKATTNSTARQRTGSWRVFLASLPSHAHDRVAPVSCAPATVDIDIPVQSVTLAPLGRPSYGGEAWPLHAPLPLAHLVQDVDVFG